MDNLVQRKIILHCTMGWLMRNVTTGSTYDVPTRQETPMNNPSSKKVKADVPAEVADFAQKSVDQAQAAFEKASDVAHGNVQTLDAAATAFKTRTADIQMKAMEIVQTNMNSAFDFVRKAFSAKDASELIALNQDFARDQLQNFTRQASELNALSVLLSRETVKPVQDSVMKSFGDFSKSFAA